MNSLYQRINKLACYHADIIWNVSPRMEEGREEIGIRRDRSAPQLTVPLGCSFSVIRRRSSLEAHPGEIVYFGSLRGEHGPGLIIEALPEILRRVPGVRVTFVGDGELRSVLERRAEELGVGDQVRFTGYVESGEEVYDILAASGLALATYPSGGDTYKTWSDPGKVKIYLASGLPILITDVPPIAREIEQRGAGIIVDEDPTVLAQAVADIVSDRESYVRMRENAIALGAEYDWDAIWKRTFDAMSF
jgi:glycosyltransferase involved in cell wall biosynthesis